MAEPMRIRATMAGDVADVKVLMNHIMETGVRKDAKTGQLIPAHFITEVTASVIRDDLVRFDNLPLVTRAPSVAGVAPGSKVRLAISSIDLLDISFHAELLETLETPPDNSAVVP